MTKNFVRLLILLLTLPAMAGAMTTPTPCPSNASSTSPDHMETDPETKEPEWHVISYCTKGLSDNQVEWLRQQLNDQENCNWMLAQFGHENSLQFPDFIIYFHCDTPKKPHIYFFPKPQDASIEEQKNSSAIEYSVSTALDTTWPNIKAFDEKLQEIGF